MLINILILAAIVERIWEHLQQLAGKRNLTPQVKLLGSAALSVAAAVALRLDLLYALQVTPGVSLPGAILTGFAIGLGSNVIHDLAGIAGSLSARVKPAGPVR